MLFLLFWIAAGLAAAPPQLPPVPPQPPQIEPRDARPDSPAPVGTASISGVVYVAGSGQPARRARVNISSNEPGIGRSASTDDQGRFGFSALPAGRYSLSASKPGYVNVSYGQRRPGPGRPGTAIQLTAGQKFAVTLQLPRGSVISGTVLDEHGEATPGTQVRALRFTMQTGRRTLQSASTAQTDDRGVYRLYGLQPGDYLVCAVPRNANSPAVDVERMEAELRALRETAAVAARKAAAEAVASRLAEIEAQLPSAGEPVAGYAPVYYPGTTAPASAITLPLGVGEEKLGVDFALQVVPVARIEGVVMSPGGAEPQNTTVTLVNVQDDVPGASTYSTRVNRDGQFTITNVPPGQYTLIARGMLGNRSMPAPAAAGQPGPPRPQDAGRLWASLDVSVDGRRVSNLVVTLQNGMTISGKVDFAGTGQQAPPDYSRVRLSLSPAGGGPEARALGAAAPGRVDATGRFTITGVMPGRYRLTANAPRWSSESASVGGQDVLDFPFEVKGGQNVSGLTVTFTDQQTELSGTITNDRDQPVTDCTIVVFPADQRYWVPDSRRIRTVRPATDGSFAIGRLPPGDYRLAPVVDPEPGAWFDPGFLQQLDASAQRLSLATGEKKVQNLRVTGGSSRDEQASVRTP